MPTTTTQNDVTRTSFWRKLFNWMRAFEEAMDIDPRQGSIDHLSRQVAELKDTVDKLQKQLNSAEEERS